MATFGKCKNEAKGFVVLGFVENGGAAVPSINKVTGITSPLARGILGICAAFIMALLGTAKDKVSWSLFLPQEQDVVYKVSAEYSVEHEWA